MTAPQRLPPQSPTPATLTTDGIYRICARISDTAGNAIHAATPTLTRDTVVPALTLQTGHTGGIVKDGTTYLSAGDTLILSLTAPEALQPATVTGTLTIAGTDQAVTLTRSGSAFTYRYTVPSDINTDTITIAVSEASITDLAGNAAEEEPDHTITNIILDAVAPVLTVSPFVVSEGAGSVTATVTDTRPDTDSYLYRIVSDDDDCDASTGGESFTSGTAIAVDPSSSGYLCVQARDLAGNTTTIARDLSVQVPPKVTFISSLGQTESSGGFQSPIITAQVDTGTHPHGYLLTDMVFDLAAAFAASENNILEVQVEKGCSLTIAENERFTTFTIDHADLETDGVKALTIPDNTVLAPDTCYTFVFTYTNTDSTTMGRYQAVTGYTPDTVSQDDWGDLHELIIRRNGVSHINPSQKSLKVALRGHLLPEPPRKRRSGGGGGGGSRVGSLSLDSLGDFFVPDTPEAKTLFSEGDTHPIVSRVQEVLNTTVCAVAVTGPGAPGSETEYFGPATTAAVECYQEIYELTVTGTITDELLTALSISLEPAAEEPEQSETPFAPMIEQPETGPPVTLFSEGDTHPIVSRVQEVLNTTVCAVAVTGPGAPGSETEYFGPATTAAVECYQEIYELTVTGTITDELLTALSISIGPVEAPEQTEVLFAPVFTLEEPASQSQYSPGDSHVVVKLVQTILNQTVCPVAQNGPGSSGSETEYFGSATYAAIVCHQQENGLTITGTINAEVLTSIIQVIQDMITALLEQQAAPEPPEVYIPPEAPEPPEVYVPIVVPVVEIPAVSPIATLFSEGDTHETVRLVQIVLNATPCPVAAAGPGSPGFETGYFGPATTEAVICYQSLHGLNVTGTITDELLTKLSMPVEALLPGIVSVLPELPEHQAPSPPPLIDSQFYQEEGSDELVLRVQEALNQTPCAITVGAGSSGSETDYFGPATREAVICYQKLHGLTVTGTITDEVIAMLGVSYVPGTEAVHQALPALPQFSRPPLRFMQDTF